MGPLLPTLLMVVTCIHGLGYRAMPLSIGAPVWSPPLQSRLGLGFALNVKTHWKYHR